MKFIACATVLGKVPYYEGINIKSATPTKLFSSIVMPINSWSIKAGTPYKKIQIRYTLPQQKVTRDFVDLVFHGAKNTKYILFFDNLSGDDFSFGIPSDYSYFFGINFYVPDAIKYDYQFISTSLNIKSSDNIKDFNYFTKFKFEIITDNNGDYVITLSNCNYYLHYADAYCNIFMEGYEDHKLSYHLYLPNTNDSTSGIINE